MKKKLVTAKADVRVRLSVLIDEALEQATAHACRRAFKHRDQPLATAEQLILALDENLVNAFWSALSELGVEVE